MRRIGWIEALKQRISFQSGFEKSKLEYQLKCIKNTSLCLGITIVVYFISIIIRQTGDTLTFIGLPFFLIFTFMLHFCSMRARVQKLVPAAFTIYLATVFIGLFQFSKKYFQGDSKKEIFMAAFTSSNVMCIVLLSRLSWISVIFLLAIQSGFVTSLIDVEESGIKKTIAPEIPLVAFAVFVYFSQITFHLDSFERRQYSELAKKSRTIESIKKVLCSRVPDQILIFPRNLFTSRKIYFANEPATTALNSESSEDIVRKLERIQFTKNSSGTDLELTILNNFLKTYVKTDGFKNFLCKIRFLPEDRVKTTGSAKNKRHGLESYGRIPSSPINSTIQKDFLLNTNENDNNDRANREWPKNNESFSEAQENPERSQKESEIGFEGQYEVHIGNVEWEGEADDEFAVILIMREISHRQKVIELQHLHELKDQMLASVSHDLRTPLNGIIGLIQTTLDMNINAEVSSTLGLAINSANSLLFLINDLLDITQLKNGKLSMNYSLVNVRDLIEPVMKLVGFLAEKKKIRLLLDNKLPESILARADVNRFRQILFNLLGNAVKFTTEGFVKLTIKEKSNVLRASSNPDIVRQPKSNCFSSISEMENQEDKIIELIVEDSGIGIKPADIEKLKKPFGKLKNSQNPTGVGLGLAISNTLAKMMAPTPGNGIEIRSEFGKGSWFSFCLSAVSRREEYSGTGSITCLFNDNPRLNRVNTLRDFEIKVTRNLNHRTHVLIVDDDPINQIVVNNYLKSFNHLEITTANNGAEALQAVNQAMTKSMHFEIIFMDCNMPIMNGFQSTQKINEMVANALIPKPKIFALTGYNSEDEMTKCQKLGMTVLLKPLNKENFISVVRSALN